jgi:hypothetical protein
MSIQKESSAPHYSKSHIKSNGTLCVNIISSNGNIVQVNGDICPECFDEHSVGLILDDGWCSKCGQRLFRPKDYVDEFIKSLNIKESTKVQYKLKLAAGDEKLNIRLEEWKEKHVC